MLRKPSIRLQDISTNNANRKPLFFLQQIKNYQDQQVSQEESNNTPAETPTMPITEQQPSVMDDTPNDSENESPNLDKEEVSQEEDEYNEEESRKMDEMMGVIDVPDEPILDEVPLANEEDLEVPSVVPIVPEMEEKDLVEEELPPIPRAEPAILSALREDSTRKNSNPMMQMNQVDPDMEFEMVQENEDRSPDTPKEDEQKATQFEEVEVDMD